MESTQKPLKDKLRVTEATERYPIGKSTLWALAKKGILTATKVSAGITVFDRRELDAYFNGEKLGA